MSTRTERWKFWRRSSPKPAGSAVREFIYLDEISVISLLVSREGEVTEQIQEGSTREDQIQTDSSAGVSVKGLKAESKSSFQTKNSQSVQTTRKANIQSQFRRLHKRAIKEKLTFPGDLPRRDIKNQKDLLRRAEICRAEKNICRGDLMEFTVTLRADPSYRMGAMITELVNMSDEHPEVFGTVQASISSEMRSYGRLLDRFMTGLVPVKASIKNLRRLSINGSDYLVNAEAAARLGLSTTEIQLVGVTDKDSYWKDMRRVLFSDQEVTILARVNDKSIKDSWSPVKLVDLFEGTIPGLRQQFSTLSRLDLQHPSMQSTHNSELFRRALIFYAEDVTADRAITLTQGQRFEIERLAEELGNQVGTQEAQRSAFRHIQQKLNTFGATIEPNRAAQFRRQARNRAALPLFSDSATTPLWTGDNSDDSSDEQLLEVEIIAMYW
ncbi:DUF6414 family protein [Nocardia cyriacigeorgica]|uniref:DUF6414 family protein n=1 Tax=Nocardia cyriacigeorgica TaxID=135487 RepID=UPI001894A683|nr:hypothetical protein [Nocardia cyriacigeorgica]MBF6157644.1 hypothetical protein [Nocardia cyriacigeorgica]MBF6196615.1 hypothetical protein [Nocardia cyriacigeorgica]